MSLQKSVAILTQATSCSNVRCVFSCVTSFFSGFVLSKCLQHCFCRILYLSLRRPCFRSCWCMYTLFQSQKGEKIWIVTRTKSDFSVIFNHFIWMDTQVTLYKSLFWQVSYKRCIYCSFTAMTTEGIFVDFFHTH